MKKTLLITMLLCLTLSVMAQDKYELYKCSELSSRSKIDNKWTEWEDNECDILVRMCITENKLEINNQAKTVFYFGNTLSTKSLIDEDGDVYTQIEWTGYDQEGIKCHLISLDWTHLKNRNFIIAYNNFEIIYRSLILN